MARSFDMPCSRSPPIWPGPLLQMDDYIPGSMTDSLQVLGKAQNASLAAVIAAAATVHLSRVTGARDVILGMAVSGRTSAKLRRVVGLASNVVPSICSSIPAHRSRICSANRDSVCARRC